MSRDRDGKLIVYLEVSSFSLSSGRWHYYGTLKSRRNDGIPDVHEVTRIIDAKGAAELNRYDSGNSYQAGDVTWRFDSEAALLCGAIAQYKDHYPDVPILIKGSEVYAEPQLVLAASDSATMRALNTLYIRCSALGWWDGGHEREVTELDKKWNDLLDEFLKACEARHSPEL